MDATAFPAFDLPETEILVSLLISQVPILLGLTLLACAGDPRPGSFRSLLNRNLLVWLAATLAYTLVGFVFMYPVGPKPDFLAHWRDLFGLESASAPESVALPRSMFLADLMVQASFCAVACLLAAAALPRKRGHWLVLLFACVFGAVVFPVFGRWHWGGGWLSERGFHDFAGGTLIYGTAGVAALTVAFLFRDSRSPLRPEPSRSRNLAWLLGIAFLWLIPSALALAGSPSGDDSSWRYPPGQLAVDSCAAAGALGALFLSLATSRRVVISKACTGLLAGMATAAAGADALPVQALAVAACAAGALSGPLSDLLARARLGDPVAAIAGFGIGGTVGSLAVGFHASTPGIQVLGLAANAAWTALTVAAFLVFLLRPPKTKT